MEVTSAALHFLEGFHRNTRRLRQNYFPALQQKKEDPEGTPQQEEKIIRCHPHRDICFTIFS